MSKKLFLAIGLAIAIIFSFSVTLSFATENTMQNAGNDVVNGVRDVVGGAENAVEDAVKGVGDGINDSPSLTNSDVGISVDTAVDIAKETADIILLEKDLNVLIDGVTERKAYIC